LRHESEALFDELDPDGPPGEGLDQLAQLVEVASEAIHAVHDHRAAFPDERQHGFELGSVDVFARRLGLSA